MVFVTPNEPEVPFFQELGRWGRENKMKSFFSHNYVNRSQTLRETGLQKSIFWVIFRKQDVTYCHRTVRKRQSRSKPKSYLCTTFQILSTNLQPIIGPWKKSGLTDDHLRQIRSHQSVIQSLLVVLVCYTLFKTWLYSQSKIYGINLSYENFNIDLQCETSLSQSR